MAEAFVARTSLWKSIYCFFVGSALFALSALGPEYFGMVPKVGWELMRWPTLALAALVMAASVKGFFDDRIQMRVDDSGILLRSRAGAIPWSAIARGRVVRVYSSWPFYLRCIALDLRDPHRSPPRRFWRLFKGDVVFSGVGTDRSTTDLITAIRNHAPPAFELSEL